MRYVAMMVTLLVALMMTASAAAQGLPGSLVSIPTSDGYRLQAYVAVPQGNGPFPLVVMPSAGGSMKWNTSARPIILPPMDSS